ncbi:MAG: TIGR03663 family protein [Verrucomicrobiales bacterium]|nr:TIGR03663 family protein [Verrucomicrobiales bacterium]
MNRWGAVAAVLLALAGAFALRLPQLDLRPLHNDEAVNALKLAELWQHGRYRYDPDEFHGPSLHYFCRAVLRLAAAPEPADWTGTHLRLTPVLFGVALIPLLLLFANGLGRGAVAWAAVFTAVSGATVFYSRYFIHETLLVFFTTLALGAAWRWYQTRRAVWAAIAGLGVGLMWATKETFVITLGAVAVALVAVAVTEHRAQAAMAAADSGATATGRARQHRTWLWHVVLAGGVAGAIWLLFFSSFFTNWLGLLDSFRTYVPWVKRAGGASPHIHPWYFYLERLAWFHPPKSPVWSEGLILALAAVGTGVSLLGKKSALHRFLAIYTPTLTAAYSVISYKTPWCLLSFWQGMILLAGVGAVAVLDAVRGRALKVAVVAVLAGLTAQLAWQAWRGSFVFFADRRNPYVYAQTVPHLLKLVERVEAVAAAAPAGRETVVQVIAPEHDYGPLPWYLRRLKHVGWYDALPGEPFAPMVIVAARLDARLDDKTGRRWIMVGLFEQRPGVFLELYVERDLWTRFVSTLKREVEPE